MPNKPLGACQQEAYTHVLRAFQVQKSNDWSRQKLLINLRRELKISSEQHLSTLNEVVNDPELKDLVGALGKDKPAKQGSDSFPHAFPPPSQNRAQPEVHESPQDLSKGQRPGKKASNQAAVGQHRTHPSKSPLPSTTNQSPSSLSADQDPNSTASTSTPSAPPHNTHQIGPNGVNVFVGKRLKSFWPDLDPQWLESVVTDYDVHTRKHCLTYDYNTGNESWEWVDLDKMLRDGQVRLLSGSCVDLGGIAAGKQLKTPKSGRGDGVYGDGHGGAKRISHGMGGGAHGMGRKGVRKGVMSGVERGSRSLEKGGAASAKLLGKRARLEQNGAANGASAVHAPFNSSFFYDRLKHGTLDELETMLLAVNKRQKLVLDKLVEVKEDRLRGEDPLLRALVEREKLERRGEDIEREAGNVDHNGNHRDF